MKSVNVVGVCWVLCAFRLLLLRVDDAYRPSPQRCTCCCKEDIESGFGDSARTNGAKHASHAAVSASESEAPTQEFPEHSNDFQYVRPQKANELPLSPTMEVIAQSIGLGSTSSNENPEQEGQQSSLPNANIVSADNEKPREATHILENDQAPLAYSANQAPDQTNDTEHVKATTLDSIADTDRNTVEPVLPGAKQDQASQSPDNTNTREPIELEEESSVPASTPAAVETNKLPDNMLKKEGDEGSDHDRKESSEKMPTFVEWKQKMLAEHEKGGEQLPEVRSSPPKKKPTGSKSRRNYASYECGAKVLATNAEADGAGRVLSEQMDEYMLNPCKAKIWFVIELCEMIQVSQVDIANFELFSSMPKEFAVLMSDRYPTRDWTPLGIFTALDQKVVQSFELHSEAYGKYIKVELLSRYGSEHYCPLSLVRVFGTSMIDDYEQLVEKPRDPSAQDDDEEEASTERSASKNVVDRAKDVVISLFKVLRRDQEGEGADSVASAPCKDLHANCSVVNASHQAQNATARRLGCQKNRSRQFFGSVFQPCTMCSLFVGQSKVTQTLSETIACRFLRTALSLEDDCPIDEPDEERDPSKSTGSFSDVPQETDSSSDLTAASSSSEKTTVPVPTQSSSTFSANATSEVEQSKSIALPSSDTAQPESMKASSSPMSATAASSVEASTSVDHKSHYDNETESEDLGSASEPSHRESTTLHTSTASTTLQSSSQASDSTTDSVTATPIIMDVPTSVKTSPSSTSTAGAEIASPVVDSALPNSVTTVLGVPPTSEVDSGVLVVGPETDGGSVVATVPLPLDELVHDADLQLREAGVRAPPPEAGALALSNQRESVFMRINNRIKALELNMSLSGQYLEELSRRYRHQMDDMQRAFNRTVNALNKTAQKAAEKDLRQQETLVQLQQQLDNLTQVVNTLLAERQTLSKQIFESHICLILIEAIILATVFSLCLRRIRTSPAMLAQQESAVRPLTPGRLVLKRRTASVGHEERIEELATVAEKKQRPSNEDLGTNNSFVIVEPTMPIVVEAPPAPKEKAKKVNKQKRHKGPRRKTSLPCYPSSKTETGSRAKESCIPESNAGVLFSSKDAPRNTPPVPKTAGARTPVVAAAKGIGTGTSKFQRGAESKGGQNGTLKNTSTLQPADCIRWSGQSCCDKDDRLGLKFLRLPGKTPV
ncbi:SUN domain-containing ossification factor isoform X1 [Dermacentor variabilis]|uniref:SUN domain-containing ossification factor isoform X1 n=1 Tax=Dermacentor variabilis TaxID=34621 RepID=UPI003F5B1ABE